VPTKKPHIILDFAHKHGKQHEMQEVLFRAYFSEGRNVSSDDVLKELVSEVGLNPNEALGALADTKYIREFEEAIKETKLKGQAISVPAELFTWVFK
jgi:predicted DsbA family dithiol-disulfide isomerase